MSCQIPPVIFPVTKNTLHAERRCDSQSAPTPHRWTDFARLATVSAFNSVNPSETPQSLAFEFDLMNLFLEQNMN
jgi:hypothetical protein